MHDLLANPEKSDLNSASKLTYVHLTKHLTAFPDLVKIITIIIDIIIVIIIIIVIVKIIIITIVIIIAIIIIIVILEPCHI